MDRLTQISKEIERLQREADHLKTSNDPICDNFKPSFLGEYKIENNQRKSWALCVNTDDTWSKKGDFYEVTEWANGEGWDITIERSHSKDQISLHFTDLEALLKLLMTAGAITDNQLLNKINEDE
jgi:hypothetical protein